MRIRLLIPHRPHKHNGLAGSHVLLALRELNMQITVTKLRDPAFGDARTT